MAIWGLKKLAVVIGSSVVGVGALTGISVAAVQASNSADSSSIPSNNDSSNPSQDEEMNSQGTNNGGINNDQANNDQTGNNNQTVNLQSYFEVVEKNLTVFEKDKVNEKKELDKSAQFGYGIENNQLGLKDDAELRDKVNVELSVSDKNNTKTYNEGNLLVNVKLITKGNESSSETKEITLTGFKKVGEDFQKFFKEKVTNGSEYSLDLEMGNLKANIPLFTIKDLNTKVDLFTPRANEARMKLKARDDKPEAERKELTTASEEKKKVSSLTSFFWNKNKDNDNSENLGEISIEGETKLEAIVKDESKGVLFKLVSADKKTPLRLVKKDKDEALIESIFVNNIAATDVSVKPVSSKESYAAEFKQEIKEVAEFIKEKGDVNLDRDLAIDLAKQQPKGAENFLFVKPYLIENIESSNDPYKLGVEITVSFGDGQNVKTYKTSSEQDLETLKEAGFSFEIYTKKLTQAGGDEKMLHTAIKNSAELIKVFDANNHNKLIQKPVREVDKFKVQTIDSSALKTSLEVSIAKDSGSTFDGNYLLVTGYKYTFKADPAVNDKLLFTSNLSLVKLASEKA